MAILSFCSTSRRVLSVDEIATLASLGESDTSEAVSASLN